MKPPYRKSIAAIILVLMLALTWVPKAAAQTPEPEQYPVYIYLFWGEGCPYCMKAKLLFAKLAETYPEVVLRSYEIYHNAENQQLLGNMAASHGFEVSGVPTILIGPYYLVGYSEELNQDIESVVVYCIENGCLDAGTGLVTDDPSTQAQTDAAAATPVPTAAAAEEKATALPPAPPVDGMELGQSHLLDLPFLGVVNLDQQSLLLSTALIAFVDGFNPCSLWVLSMLMALVIHTGSRKKVLLIGLIFLTVTAAIYALFIAGLFSVLRLVSFMGWIQVLVALVAFGFGAVNVKDYFWYKSGVSFTISDKYKPGIFQRMRRVLASSDSVWGLAGATVVMAAGVSLVEFSCTAGFPVLWTNLLVGQGVSAGSFALLLLLYLVIYQIDELVIFGSMVITLKTSRLEEKQGRVLKLFGGVLMLALAAVMIFDPSLMNNLATSTAIFVVAFSIASLTLIVHRIILPQLGIWIGSEQYAAAHTERSINDQGERK
jgi:thiol-disulfide isomerase/thioredoxin